MNTQLVAKAFKELGHPSRLSIFRCLVKAGPEGLPVGEIKQSLDIPNSTLSHHVSALVAAGLIRQHREGTTLYCIPRYETLDGLIEFLVKDCCAGSAPSLTTPKSC
mgnify:FL=1